MRTLLLILLLLLLALVSMMTGSIDVHITDVVRYICGAATVPEVSTSGISPHVTDVVLTVRWQQTVTAALTGAALAAAGLVMQTLFRNPLADPSLLGVGAGASLGAAIALLGFGGSVTLAALTFAPALVTVAAALTGALLVMAYLVGVSRWVSAHAALLVVGVMVSMLLGAVTTLLSYHATAEGVRSFVIWGMGDFGGVGSTHLPLYAIIVLVPLMILQACTRQLDALMLGDGYAASLGLDVRRSRGVLLFLAGWLTAVATAFCGPIAFVGLAVPHIARRLSPVASHHLLVPMSILAGAGVCLLCNIISRAPLMPITLPINALTPLVGAPVVIALMLRRRG